MAGKKRWTVQPTQNGIKVITLSSWKWFSTLVSQKLLGLRTYVYRGQASNAWPLQSSLDRALKGTVREIRPFLRTQHLDRFRQAACGRRGPNPAPLKTENDLWALGQHNGLATPLLDWTESPFVALYFAFADDTNEASEYRAVWAISQKAVAEMSGANDPDEEEPVTLELFRPLSDENPRLVSQRGVFLRVPHGVTVEDLVAEHFGGVTRRSCLIQIRIPDTDRNPCLQLLNTMNINHLSLFPDLFGASHHCNRALRIRNY